MAPPFSTGKTEFIYDEAGNVDAVLQEGKANYQLIHNKEGLLISKIIQMPDEFTGISIVENYSYTFFPATSTTSEQDSLLTTKWEKLTNQFKHRAQIAEELGAFVLSSKSADTLSVKQLKIACHSLTQILNESTILTKQSIGAVKSENQSLIKTLSKTIMSTENDAALRATDDFKNLLSSLQGAENRIAVAKKEYNEACKTAGSEALLYE